MPAHSFRFVLRLRMYGCNFFLLSCMCCFCSLKIRYWQRKHAVLQRAAKCLSSADGNLLSQIPKRTLRVFVTDTFDGTAWTLRITGQFAGEATPVANLMAHVERVLVQLSATNNADAGRLRRLSFVAGSSSSCYDVFF